MLGLVSGISVVMDAATVADDIVVQTSRLMQTTTSGNTIRLSYMVPTTVLNDYR